MGEIRLGLPDLLLASLLIGAFFVPVVSAGWGDEHKLGLIPVRRVESHPGMMSMYNKHV